ncbi:MAG: phosphate ABC transporter permease PstA [Halanaerobiales bacterium]|nr:phosphate ABC transporter permease PstA [Halanaerobiales bacterium]
MDRLKRRKLTDKIFKYIFLGFIFIGILVLFVLLFDVFRDGIKMIDMDFFTRFDSRFPKRAGIKAGLFGTIYVIGLMIPITFVVGTASAIYLEEYAPKNWITEIIRLNIANLAGVPSIIYGMLGLGVLVRTLSLGRSVLAGALTLSLLVLPVVIVSAQEALRSVPSSLRKASYGMGANHWQTVSKVVLPAALPSIITGFILAISRAIGETAPLIMMGALTFVMFTPESIMDSFTVLPIQIFNWTSLPKADFHLVAAAASSVLLVLLFILNGIATFIRYKYEVKF